MAASRLYLPVVVGALMGCGGAPSASPPAPATVLVASQVPAAASGTDTHGSPAGMTAQQAATQFWVRLGRRDYAGAVVLATYPFDLDGHDGCVGSAAELEQAFVDKPLPADQELVVGRTRLIDERGSGLGPMWEARFRSFSSMGAQCLDTAAAEAGEVEYYFVEFTVNDEPVGALTRVRCHDGDCRVAGVDN